MLVLTASNLSGTAASDILYSLLQLDKLQYAKEVNFCSFVRKSNQAYIQYSPRCI